MMLHLKPVAALLAAAFASLANAEQPTTLQEITVTATSETEAERRAAVTQKTVIDRQEIEALGGLTVGEVIRKLPGIEAGAHSGDGGPSANARGMGRDSVQFLVDGERPSANARYALTTVGRLPSGELERVEILRGASAEHGGGAPVTVNLIMRKARPTTSTAFKAAIGVRGDEPNGQFTLSQGGGDKAFSWILPLTINHHGMPLEKTTQPPAGERRDAQPVAGREGKQPIHAGRIHRFAPPDLAEQRGQPVAVAQPLSQPGRAQQRNNPLGLCQSGCRHRAGGRRQPPRARGKPADDCPPARRRRAQDRPRQALRPRRGDGRPARAGHRPELGSTPAATGRTAARKSAVTSGNFPPPCASTARLAMACSPPASSRAGTGARKASAPPAPRATAATTMPAPGNGPAGCSTNGCWPRR